MTLFQHTCQDATAKARFCRVPVKFRSPGGSEILAPRASAGSDCRILAARDIARADRA